jgi:hypothetical protein
MSTYTNREKTTSAKSTSGRKSTLAQKDHRALRRIVSKNDTTTAAQVREKLIINPEDTVSTRTVRPELQNIQHLITESVAQMRK